MPDPTYAFRTLLRAISDIKEGAPVHAGTVREAFDAAGLNDAERAGAFRSACVAKYIYIPHEHLPDGTVVRRSVQSSHPARKCGYSLLYARTAKPVPAHVCEVVPNG